MGERASNLLRHHFERVVAYDLLQKLPVRHCHEIPELHAITLNISRSRAMNDPKVQWRLASPPSWALSAGSVTSPCIFATCVQLLMMGRAALTLLTGRRTEMKFTRKFRAGKTFRIFKGMPVGASVTLDRKMDGYRFLQVRRRRQLPASAPLAAVHLQMTSTSPFPDAVVASGDTAGHAARVPGGGHQQERWHRVGCPWHAPSAAGDLRVVRPLQVPGQTLQRARTETGHRICSVQRPRVVLAAGLPGTGRWTARTGCATTVKTSRHWSSRAWASPCVGK